MLKRPIILVFLSFVCLIITPAPSWATSTSQALSICVSRGTDCSVSNKDGGHEICVNNSGGRQCVKCPPLTAKDQICSVARTKRVDGVNAILTGPGQKKQMAR